MNEVARTLSRDATSPVPARLSGPKSYTLGSIRQVDPDKPYMVVHFQFNPSRVEVQMETNAGGRKSPFGSGASSQGGPSAPTRSRNAMGRANQSKATGGVSSSPGTSTPVPKWTLFDLLFDGGFTQDVSGDIKMLYAMMLPPSTNSSTEQPATRQPKVKVTLGTKTWFTGYINSITTSYDKFTPDGVPTRASIKSLIIQGTENNPGPQNPTSGGLASYSGYSMSEGDTLQSVAFSTYGQPRLWRPLAAINGIDDPLRVRPGTMLMLPTLPELLEAE